MKARLGVETSITEEVRRARARLFGHIMRMDADMIPKKVVEASFDVDYVVPGRPEKTWIQCLKADFTAQGFGIYTARSLAIKSRDGYRRRVVENRRN